MLYQKEVNSCIECPALRTSMGFDLTRKLSCKDDVFFKIDPWDSAIYSSKESKQLIHPNCPFLKCSALKKKRLNVLIVTTYCRTGSLIHHYRLDECIYNINTYLNKDDTHPSDDSFIGWTTQNNPLNGCGLENISVIDDWNTLHLTDGVDIPINLTYVSLIYANFADYFTKVRELLTKFNDSFILINYDIGLAKIISDVDPKINENITVFDTEVQSQVRSISDSTQTKFHNFVLGESLNDVLGKCFQYIWDCIRDDISDYL